MDSEYPVLSVHLVLDEPKDIAKQQQIRSEDHNLLKAMGIQATNIHHFHRCLIEHVFEFTEKLFFGGQIRLKIRRFFHFYQHFFLFFR
jgi:hypothetical protein